VNPELKLCPHFSRLSAYDFQPDSVHTFLHQDGVIDAIVQCGECRAYALMRMLDWAPPEYALRVYGLSALGSEDCAIYLRNVARGSCQVSRASAELEALVAAAGPMQELLAVDTRREKVISSGRPTPELAREPGPFPERLPAQDDARWFEHLGLDKLARVRPQPPKISIQLADFANRSDLRDFLELLDGYARDPMGGGRPLPGEVKMRVIPDLKARMLRGDALVLIARRAEKPIGLAVCLASYSTFRGMPVLNLHDLAVVPDERGKGVAKKLLEAVEDAARARNCCKITLEVREDNAHARRIYERNGFVDYAPADERVRTLFLERKL
jgi:ribosomal protein S18 acetylase RimI-like enzyme